MSAQFPPPEAVPAPTAILEALGVTAGYGDLAAVRNVSLRVMSGEIVALLGPNGAGKTTLIRALAGIVPLLGGEVRWHGNPTRAPLFRRAQQGLALVTEERSIITGLTVGDNLRLGRGGVEPAVALFPELESLMGRKAGLLSGGEQQMVSLARALAAQPAVLLADELSLGLAPLAVDRLFNGLRSAVAKSGLAVLLVEQQARRALEIADRWCLMSRGQLVSTGSTEEEDRLEGSYLGVPLNLADDEPLT
jgi:branched-chain amino acid transport system ATP-binding protein